MTWKEGFIHDLFETILICLHLLQIHPWTTTARTKSRARTKMKSFKMRKGAGEAVFKAGPPCSANPSWIQSRVSVWRGGACEGAPRALKFSYLHTLKSCMLMMLLLYCTNMKGHVWLWSRRKTCWGVLSFTEEGYCRQQEAGYRCFQGRLTHVSTSQ